MNAEVDRSEVERVLALLHLRNRRDVIQYCRGLVIQCEALFQVIVAGRHAGLHEYVYDCHFPATGGDDPESLSPKDRDLVALAANGLVPLHRRVCRAAMRVAGSFEHPSGFAAHLLYDMSRRDWHLFSLDRPGSIDHPRLHYSRAGFTRRPLPELWRELCAHRALPRSIPVRYECAAPDDPMTRSMPDPETA